MDQWKESEFCWTEVAVKDLAKAKEFYQEVLHWQFDDQTMADGTVYSMWSVAGIRCGGMYQIRPEQQQVGVPPHVMNYLTTSDADAFAARVQSNGGLVMRPVFEISGMGRMAVCKDPGGAPFSCWQALSNHKTQPPRFSHGKVGWRELLSPDAKAASTFYCKVVPDWDVEVKSMGHHDYYSFVASDGYEAGMMQIQKEWGPVTPHWSTYFNVDDCDEAVAKILALGGRAMGEVMEVEQIGRFCAVEDASGVSFAVIRMERPDEGA